MLVLLGPGFAGGDADYQRLSRLTGMVGYDLRARLKPGMWGLVKLLADASEATRLCASLVAEGFPSVVLDREIASDPERAVVWLKALSIDGDQLSLQLSERSMSVPAAALCSIVRGEVQVGKGNVPRASGGSSSATFRAVVPNASDVQVFRESMPQGSFEAFAAADLHFHSVKWIARIDARSFDFSRLGASEGSPAAALDALVDGLGLLAKVRVDRSARASSLSSFTQGASNPHPAAAVASGAPLHRAREIAGDERFDPYSRMVGEAERLLAAAAASAGA